MYIHLIMTDETCNECEIVEEGRKVEFICPRCGKAVVKAGKAEGKQRYFCKKCLFYTVKPMVRKCLKE